MKNQIQNLLKKLEITRQKALFVSLMLCPLLLDSIFRWMVSFSTEGVHLGPLALKINFSTGFFYSMLMMYSHSTSLLFLLLGFYLLLILLIVYVISAWQLKKTKRWVALLAGGLLGYFTNGLINGEIVHWAAIFGTGFNFSIICMVAGIAGGVFYYFKERVAPPERMEGRKTLFIMSDQYNFFLSISLTYICFMISMGFFSYLFFTRFYAQVKEYVPSIMQIENITNYNIHLYLFLFIVLSTFLCILFALFIAYLSNRIYGPVYAFKRHLEAWWMENNEKEKGREFRLRKSDHFKLLEEFMKKLKNKQSKKE